ncbi:MAG: TIGR04141 family sporadically distributed protein [Pseudomonadota bacterium]
MKILKPRKEKLSIYLVKDSSSTEVGKFIKIENSKTPVDLDVRSYQATLYMKKEPLKKPPPWTRLFTENQNLPEDIFGSSRSVGAALVARLNGCVFVLTFGSGFHLLKNEAIERDFGLRVTLNSVDPDKLRSLDKASYDHNPLNSRTQSSIDLDIFELDLDSEMDMLYAVTGVSKVEEFGSHVTGRDALTLLISIDLEGLSKILSETIKRYKSNLPKVFEWIDNINRVKDNDELEVLDLELDDVLADYEKHNIWLGEPEVVDWESQIGYSFDLYAKTPRHVVLTVKSLVDYLHGNGLLFDVGTLKSQAVHVNNNEYESTKKWTAYRCIYAEIIVGAENYILRNGLWYRVNRDFVISVDNYLKRLDKYDYKFPIYNHDREEDYNSHVVESDTNFELMDKKLVKIGGRYDKLEFCDLIRNGVDFVHVKYYRSSSTLSHLFSQGLVASETFISDSGFRERLNKKLPISAKLVDVTVRPDPSKYRIVYAIATNKNIPNELPFFSKVTLKNSLKMLKALNYNVSLVSLDVDKTLSVKKKAKPKK